MLPPGELVDRAPHLVDQALEVMRSTGAAVIITHSGRVYGADAWTGHAVVRELAALTVGKIGGATDYGALEWDAITSEGRLAAALVRALRAAVMEGGPRSVDPLDLIGAARGRRRRGRKRPGPSGP